MICRTSRAECKTSNWMTFGFGLREWWGRQRAKEGSADTDGLRVRLGALVVSRGGGGVSGDFSEITLLSMVGDASQGAPVGVDYPPPMVCPAGDIPATQTG